MTCHWCVGGIPSVRFLVARQLPVRQKEGAPSKCAGNALMSSDSRESREGRAGSGADAPPSGGPHPSGKAEFAIGIESNCRERRTEKGGLRWSCNRD